MKTGTIRAALAALAIMSMVSCASILAPQPDRSRFFVLSGGVDGGAAKSTALGARQLWVGVGPLQIPDYLQRSGIATRVGPTQVRYSQVNRWAEPLEELFPRVLAQDLSTSLSTNQVVLFPWPGNMRIDYQVQVNVERFELTAQDQAVLAASWIIKDPLTGQILASGETNESRPAGSDAAAATSALSQALGAMANSLASRILQLAREVHHAERKESATTRVFPSFESGTARSQLPPLGSAICPRAPAAPSEEALPAPTRPPSIWPS
jgi:uncharacterized lipoprotein YmbA